jgi:MOSC domain-containing protein YiiM
VQELTEVSQTHETPQAFLLRGELGAGEPIHRIKVAPVQITIRQLVHTAFFDQHNLEMMKNALAVPAL